VQGLPADIFDNLAESGDAMIGVRPDRAGFGGQRQAPLLILRERGQTLFKRERFREPAAVDHA
jgi:hypothetical protein